MDTNEPAVMKVAMNLSTSGSLYWVIIFLKLIFMGRLKNGFRKARKNLIFVFYFQALEIAS